MVEQDVGGPAPEAAEPTPTDLLLHSVLDYAIIGFDPGGRVTSWNVGAELLLGYSAEEILGQNVERLVTPDDLAARTLASERATATAEGRAIVEGWAVRADGTTFWAAGHTYPVHASDGSVQGFVKVISDITPRREAERRQAALLAVSRVIVEAEDLDDATPRILRAVCEVLGWDWAALWIVDRAANELALIESWHESDSALGEFEVMSRSMRLAPGYGLPGRVWLSGQPEWIPDIFADPNFPRRAIAERAGLRTGLAFPLRTAGRVIGVMEFFSLEVRDRDEAVLALMDTLASQIGQFAERASDAHALHEDEERYRVLVETASDAIILIDADGSILMVNRMVETLFGYTTDELVGQPMTLLIPEHLREAHTAGLRRYLATGTPRIPWTGVELPGRHRDGTDIPLEIAFGQFTQGGRTRFVGYARDIRERKRAEADRAELERLREEWVSIIAHDLRQPLSIIRGYAQRLDQLASRRGAAADERDPLAHILAAAENLEKMTGDLLDVSQLEAGRLEVTPQSIEITPLVSSIVERMRAVAEDRPIEVRASVSDPLVRADAGRVEQVLGNLLSNAVKYGYPGTSIEVSVQDDPRGIRISVRNQGEGIPAAEMPELFNRFRRARSATESSTPGLGLGLYLSQYLVESHGGEIWAESVPGATTTVSFTLPTADLAVADQA